MSYPKYNEDDREILQNRRMHNNWNESKVHNEEYTPYTVRYKLNEKNSKQRTMWNYM